MSTGRATTEFEPGNPGDFDFLAGSWRIRHRRAKDGGWDEFDGEATCWTILGGAGSVEDLRIPARDFAGLGLRLLDVEQRVWTDHWVNAKSGVITLPPARGGFAAGVGTFVAEELERGTRILVRGIWDRITADSCRWHQSASRDGGATWEPNWFMEWRRAMG